MYRACPDGVLFDRKTCDCTKRRRGSHQMSWRSGNCVYIMIAHTIAMALCFPFAHVLPCECVGTLSIYKFDIAVETISCITQKAVISEREPDVTSFVSVCRIVSYAVFLYSQASSIKFAIRCLFTQFINVRSFNTIFMASWPLINSQVRVKWTG